MARLIIGTVTALFSPEEARTTPDDRQEMLRCTTYDGGAFVPAVVVVDGGRAPAGDVTTYAGVKFRAADFETVKYYWSSRAKVAVTGLSGVSEDGCRVRVTSWSNSKKFAGYVTADLEIWRV